MTKARQGKWGIERFETAPPNPYGRWSRLAWTCVPLLVLLIGRKVALPGIDVARLVAQGDDVRPYNIVSLGIKPLIYAVLLVEIAAVVVPRWRHLRHGGFEGRAQLQRWSSFVAVALAILNGGSRAVFLQGKSFGIPTGILPTVIAVMTLVAGMMLLKVLADWVSRRGLASGYIAIHIWDRIIDFGKLLSIPNMHWSTMERMALSGKIASVAALTWYVLQMQSHPAGPVTARATPRNVEAHDEANPYAAPKEMRSSEDISSFTRGSGALELPAPASGLWPLAAVLTILYAPFLWQYDVPSAARVADFLRNEWIYGFVSLSLLVSLILICTHLFNEPRRVAGIYVRLQKKRGQLEHFETVAVDALRSATKSAVPYLLALWLINYMTKLVMIDVVDTIDIAVLVALCMDGGREFQVLKKRRDLVPVWPEHRPYAIAAVKQALTAAGIFVHVRDERQRRLWQFVAPYIPMEIFVPQKDAERATKILDELLLAESPATKGNVDIPKLT